MIERLKYLLPIVGISLLSAGCAQAIASEQDIPNKPSRITESSSLGLYGFCARSEQELEQFKKDSEGMKGRLGIADRNAYFYIQHNYRLPEDVVISVEQRGESGYFIDVRHRTRSEALSGAYECAPVSNP